MITKYEQFCAICNRPASEVHHLVYGTSGRNISDFEDLTVPLCQLCHRKIHEGEKAKPNDGFNRYGVMSKIIGQACYERDYIIKKTELPFWNAQEEARESFRHLFGKSFL